MREILPERHAERRHVAGGGDLSRVGEARGVAERGARHAKAARLCRHHLRETRLGATHEFAGGGSRVIGGLGDEREDCGLDGNVLTGLHAKFGRRLVRGMAGNQNSAAFGEFSALETLKQHVKRHHFGERSRITRCVRARSEHGFTRVHINDN